MYQLSQHMYLVDFLHIWAHMSVLKMEHNSPTLRVATKINLSAFVQRFRGSQAQTHTCKKVSINLIL